MSTTPAFAVHKRCSIQSVECLTQRSSLCMLGKRRCVQHRPDLKSRSTWKFWRVIILQWWIGRRSVEISGESRCNSVIVSLLALSTKTLSACNDLSGGEEWKTAFQYFFLQLSRVESPAMNHCYLSNKLRKIWKKKDYSIPNKHEPEVWCNYFAESSLLSIIAQEQPEWNWWKV